MNRFLLRLFLCFVVSAMQGNCAKGMEGDVEDGGQSAWQYEGKRRRSCCASCGRRQLRMVCLCAACAACGACLYFQGCNQCCTSGAIDAVFNALERGCVCCQSCASHVQEACAGCLGALWQVLNGPGGPRVEDEL